MLEILKEFSGLTPSSESPENWGVLAILYLYVAIFMRDEQEYVF